jgi:hypothetical protein
MKKITILGAIGVLLGTSAAVSYAPRAAHAAVPQHRDGCHRWHSCPSDTGSYVCGDLGYYTYCPGNRPAPAPYPTQCPLHGCPAPTAVVPAGRPTVCQRRGYLICVSGVRPVLHSSEQLGNGVVDYLYDVSWPAHPTASGGYMVAVAPTRADAQQINGALFQSGQHPPEGSTVRKVQHFNGTWMVEKTGQGVCLVERAAVRGRIIAVSLTGARTCVEAEWLSGPLMRAVLGVVPGADS